MAPHSESNPLKDFNVPSSEKGEFKEVKSSLPSELVEELQKRGEELKKSLRESGEEKGEKLVLEETAKELDQILEYHEGPNREISLTEETTSFIKKLVLNQVEKVLKSTLTTQSKLELAGKTWALVEYTIRIYGQQKRAPSFVKMISSVLQGEKKYPYQKPEERSIIGRTACAICFSQLYSPEGMKLVHQIAKIEEKDEKEIVKEILPLVSYCRAELGKKSYAPLFRERLDEEMTRFNYVWNSEKEEYTEVKL